MPYALSESLRKYSRLRPASFTQHHVGEMSCRGRQLGVLCGRCAMPATDPTAAASFLWRPFGHFSPGSELITCHRGDAGPRPRPRCDPASLPRRVCPRSDSENPGQSCKLLYLGRVEGLRGWGAAAGGTQVRDLGCPPRRLGDPVEVFLGEQRVDAGAPGVPAPVFLPEGRDTPEGALTDQGAPGIPLQEKRGRGCEHPASPSRTRPLRTRPSSRRNSF